MSSAPSYRETLSHINNIRQLLFALGFSRLEANSVAEETRSPYLDKLYRNIRAQLLRKIPETQAAILAHHDRVNNRLTRVYSQSNDEKLRKKARGVAGCAEQHFVMFSKDEKTAMLLPSRCKSRFCWMCSRLTSWQYFERAMETIEKTLTYGPKGTNPSWLTLTIKNPPFGGLKAGVSDLLSAFKNFRRSATHRVPGIWETAVGGYIWNLEVTINNAKRTWHPHIHVLADARYMAQKAIVAHWRAILARHGLRGHVSIGRAYTRSKGGARLTPRPGQWTPGLLKGCLREVTKYQLKPIEGDRIADSEIIEITRALHNRRLHGSGGLWKIPGDKTEEAKYYPAKGLWQVLRETVNPTACLMQETDELGAAFRKSQSDTIAFFGLLRRYPQCGEALHYLINDQHGSKPIVER